MRSNGTFRHRLLRGITAMSIALYPVLSVAQDVAKTTSSDNAARTAASDAPVVTAAAKAAPRTATPAVSAPNKAPGQNTYSVVVFLRIDGNLAGRVSALDTTGTKQPAKAHVSFVQRAKTVATADSNERGQFQVPRLRRACIRSSPPARMVSP